MQPLTCNSSLSCTWNALQISSIAALLAKASEAFRKAAADKTGGSSILDIPGQSMSSSADCAATADLYCCLMICWWLCCFCAPCCCCGRLGKFVHDKGSICACCLRAKAVRWSPRGWGWATAVECMRDHRQKTQSNRDLDNS